LYYYNLQVFDLGTGQMVAEAEGVQEIGNQAWEIQLISPGSPMVEQLPEPVFTNLPVFQWFSQAESFDFSLYEVRDHTVSPEDVTQSLPVYRQNGIKTPTIWWPNSAEPLIKGKTYAWQVKANISSTSGARVLSSPVWWFTIGKSEPGSPSLPLDAELLVEPDGLKLATGQVPVQYTLIIRDQNQVQTQVQSGVVWKVVPSFAGTITQTGKFYPGERPLNCAIVAQYGEKSQFADAVIEWKPDTDFSGYMHYFIRELFGLP
jgi:hypothetical protein